MRAPCARARGLLHTPALGVLRPPPPPVYLLPPLNEFRSQLAAGLLRLYHYCHRGIARTLIMLGAAGPTVPIATPEARTRRVRHRLPHRGVRVQCGSFSALWACCTRGRRIVKPRRPEPAPKAPAGGAHSRADVPCECAGCWHAAVYASRGCRADIKGASARVGSDNELEPNAPRATIFECGVGWYTPLLWRWAWSAKAARPDLPVAYAHHHHARHAARQSGNAGPLLAHAINICTIVH